MVNKPPLPIIRAVIIAAIVGLIGWIGLDIPQKAVEETVDQQLAAWQQDATATDTSTSVATPSGQPAVVLSVIDGDTARVRVGEQVETVRFIGIDTPETATSPAGLACYGEEATIRAKELLTDKTIIVATDPTQDEYDQYGRLLVYALLPSGIDFGQTMIEEGFAREYTFIKSYQNQAAYTVAQATAQAAGRGLWTACE